MSPKWISLKAKVALVIFMVSSVSFAVFFISNYRNTIRSIHTHTTQLIAQDHRSHATHIIDTLSAMQRDSEAITGFPPISGILRSLATAEGIDPRDGSSLDEWRRRLETLFASMIGSRGYSQMRLILPQNNWREYVRVNKKETTILTTPWSELQVKGEEPYIYQITEKPATSFQFSNVTRNREHNKISGPPTIRSLQTIYTKTGAIAGVIVINALISEFLTVQQATSQFSNTFYAIKNVTDATTPLDVEDLRFSVLTANSEALEQTDDVFELPKQQLVALDDDTGIFISQVDTDTLDPPFIIRVVTKIDMAPLYSVARSELNRNLINATLLTLFATLAGLVFTARLLQPLQNLVEEIQGRSSPLIPIKMNLVGNDEVSVIGQSFTHTTNSLIRETQRLDMVLNNIADGIITLKPGGIIEDLNPAAEKILNTHVRSAIGRKLADFLGYTELFSTLALENQLAGGKMLEKKIEISIEHATNSQTNLEITLKKASYLGENRVIALIRDVTAQAIATKQLNALISALKKSNAELDQFAYVASHDLKAPLRVISNAVSWLEEDLTPHLTDDTRESMSLLKSRASRMERLLNDLLQHSRIGRIAEPNIEVTGLEMADDILQLLEVPAGIQVLFSDEFLAARLKKLPLETVLVNLIGNGIKHHNKPRGYVNIALKDEGQFLRLSIEDDGPGIDPRYHDRIFEVFQTLKSRDQLESSGMGLAFVKKYIDVVGGEIKVISEGTNGTKFELLWPNETSQRTEAA